MEKLLIKKLKSNTKEFGHNVSLGGDGYLGCDNHGENNPMFGRHHSDISKEKMRKQKIQSYLGEGNPFYGKKHSLETKMKTSKPVVQLDSNMHYINEYYSAHEASLQTGIDRKSISAVCGHYKNRKIAGGYKWMFKKEYDEMFLVS